MGRIRTIKPEFWLSEGMARVSRDDRLLAIALLNYVDREGRCEDRPARIKAALFPYESDHDFNIEAALSNLSEPDVDYLERYEADGKRCIQIRNFNKHQRPNVNEAASTLPAPTEHENDRASTKMNSESRDASIPLLHSSSSKIGSSSPALVLDPSKPEKATKTVARTWPGDLLLTPEMRAYAIQGGIENPEREFQAWKNDCEAHGRTYKSWSAAWRARVDNAPRFANRNGTLPLKTEPDRPRPLLKDAVRKSMESLS
jgi:hypothetical protein